MARPVLQIGYHDHCFDGVASAATFLRFGWDFSALAELIDWAEVIDGAQFPDAKTAVELTKPAMQLMLLIEATKDPELCPRLIRELSQRPFSAVVHEPWVVGPLSPLLA